MPQNYLLFIHSTEKEYAFVHVDCRNTGLQYVHGKPLTISLKCSKSNHLPPGYSLIYMALHVSMCVCECVCACESFACMGDGEKKKESGKKRTRERGAEEARCVLH